MTGFDILLICVGLAILTVAIALLARIAFHD